MHLKRYTLMKLGHFWWTCLQYGFTDDMDFHGVFEVPKYYNHRTNISPSWCRIVPTHGRHRKFNIKSPNVGCIIFTTNKHHVPLSLILYHKVGGVHFWIIYPLKWISIVLECGIKEIFNIFTYIIDLNVIWKIMCWFNIICSSSHIYAEIGSGLFKSLQWEYCITPPKDTIGLFTKDNNLIRVDVDAIILIPGISHPEFWIFPESS